MVGDSPKVSWLERGVEPGPEKPYDRPRAPGASPVTPNVHCWRKWTKDSEHKHLGVAPNQKRF